MNYIDAELLKMMWHSDAQNNMDSFIKQKSLKKRKKFKPRKRRSK